MSSMHMYTGESYKKSIAQPACVRYFNKNTLPPIFQILATSAAMAYIVCANAYI